MINIHSNFAELAYEGVYRELCRKTYLDQLWVRLKSPIHVLEVLSDINRQNKQFLYIFILEATQIGKWNKLDRNEKKLVLTNNFKL